MNCQRITDRQIFQNQLSKLNPGAHDAVERMVSTIRRSRQAAREARQQGMTPDGVQRPKFDAEVQKSGGAQACSHIPCCLQPFPPFGCWWRSVSGLHSRLLRINTV